MDKTRENISKIYCEKCNEVFQSREKYDKHYSRHSSGTSCESCPIDTIFDKIFGIFKRGR